MNTLQFTADDRDAALELIQLALAEDLGDVGDLNEAVSSNMWLAKLA
jgi:hypothetical protein